jgi:hypothetical protein
VIVSVEYKWVGCDVEWNMWCGSVGCDVFGLWGIVVDAGDDCGNVGRKWECNTWIRLILIWMGFAWVGVVVVESWMWGWIGIWDWT